MAMALSPSFQPCTYASHTSSTVAVDGKLIEVTISLGLASWNRSLSTQDQLLAEADKALYAAKQGGRNRVAVSQSSAFAD